MGEVILFLREFELNSKIVICRICHEEEFESCKSLESPCACSGTVKFAHRDCIQRWCDEKGNTTCEICLQKFQPGYTTIPKKSEKVETIVTVRESLEERRQRRLREREEIETNYSIADWRAKCCRKVALFITVLLMLRHVFDTIAIGTEDYPFTLTTLLIIRASGILLPMYIINKVITAIQNSIKRQHQESIYDTSYSDYEGSEGDESSVN